MEYKILSYTGKSTLHEKNEDHHIVGEDYVIIADGMGGECDGEIASDIAVETGSAIFAESLPKTSSDPEIRTISEEAIYEADFKISRYIENHPESLGMGTTILLAIIKNRKIYLSWCGDSHAYVYREGKITSLTKDHSYVQQLVDSGQITMEETYTHPDNNVITRFVGGGKETCVPDFSLHPFSEDEIIILCSDGLSGYCRSDEIARTVKNNRKIEDLPKQLAELAIQQGSEDDITIVVLAHKTYRLTRPGHSIFGWLEKLLKSHSR